MPPPRQYSLAPQYRQSHTRYYTERTEKVNKCAEKFIVSCESCCKALARSTTKQVDAKNNSKYLCAGDCGRKIFGIDVTILRKRRDSALTADFKCMRVRDVERRQTSSGQGALRSFSLHCGLSRSLSLLQHKVVNCDAHDRSAH